MNATNDTSNRAISSAQPFLAEGGEMGERMRSHDWSASPLGDPSSWPQSLRSVVGLLLNSRFPMFVAWGEELGFLYNDAYIEVLGTKHPGALGARLRDIWSEIWADISPLIDAAMVGEATYRENLPLLMQRKGFAEPTWFTFSYSPVHDESGVVAGMFCACTETTGQVLAERRLADEAARHLQLFEQAPGFICILRGPAHVYEFVNSSHRQLFGSADWVGKPVRKAAPQLAGQGFFKMLDQVYATCERYVGRDVLVRNLRLSDAHEQDQFIDFIFAPMFDDGGQVNGIFCEGFDVTEAHHAREALRESEARLKLALDAASAIGTWDWDMRNDRVYADARFAKLYSVDPQRAAQGVQIADFLAGVHPDDRDFAGAAIQTAIDNAIELQVEYRLLQSDGAVHWVLARGRAYYDDDGQPTRFPGVAVDITQRKRGEEERARLFAQFEALAENVSQLTWMAEPDGSIFWYNKRWYDYTGTDLQAMQGWGWRKVHHPDHVERIINEVQRQWAEGKAFEGTYLLRSADGEYRWFLTRVEPIRNAAGELLRWFGTNTDITAQRAIETRQQFLLSLTERLQHLVEPREIVAATVEVLGQHLGVSRAGYGEVCADDENLTFLTDYTDGVAHLVGTFPAVAFGRGNMADLRRGLTTTYADTTTDPRTSDADFAAIETRAAMAVPLVRHGHFRAVLYLNHRHVRAWSPDEVALVEDVAARTWDALERARAEAELRELNATLEQRIAERTSELEQLHETLRQSQKMESVGQLTGGIAHDFNNMLAVVIGSLDLLARRPSVNDPRARRYIDAASDGARRAALLTQRLLAFSRQQPLRPEAVDANRLLTGMADLLRRSLGSDIRFETVLAGGHWRTYADPNQLENVLLNLAVNARDAMADGGKLTIETQNAHLDARYVADLLGVPAGQYVLIAVTDTGSGMAEETIARAFDPFFTTKAVGKGTGLGLSQAYGFVKQSGGHVKIYSEPGHGTTVKIYLPRYMTAEAETIDADPAGDLPLGERDEVVLVVEDEPAVRQFSVDALTELGYRVIEADGAAAALRLLDAHSEIALLFTDVVMPDTNGRKLADEAQRRRPDLKVLFTTGYTRNAVVHNGILDAGVKLIGKPFTVEELAARVREVLDAPH